MKSKIMAAIQPAAGMTFQERNAFFRTQRELMTAAIREQRRYPRLAKTFCRLSVFCSPKCRSLIKLTYPLGIGLCMFSFLFALTGCLSRSLTSLQITPAAGSSTVVAGQTTQFQAMATYTESGHATTTANVTSQVTWASSTPAVATINSTGLSTGVSAGTANISASIEGSFGTVVGTSNVAVTAAPPPRILTSIVVVPAAQTVTTTDETSQFIAIGTYSAAPLTQDLTAQVKWQSSDVKVANIDASGLVTGIGAGEATITALATASDGSVISATGMLTNSSATGPVNLPTLTVYEVGNGTGTVTGINTTNGSVVITCGPGLPATGCTGNFPVATVVELVASPAGGSQFDGWSANCIPSKPNSTDSCTVTMNNNDTVGAIFDLTNP